MPLILPKELPAAKVLADENIFVINHQRAVTQDIRPLDILIVNLMPDKIATETQLARMLANSPLQVRLTLLRTGTHLPTHTPGAHIAAFYKTLDEVVANRYDGMIITGAPVEQMEFAEVDYWPELRTLFDFARSNVFSTMYLCWAAMAHLWHRYAIPKENFAQKLSGVYKHRVVRPTNPLVRGFDDTFYVPHSRWAGVPQAAVAATPALRVLAQSDVAGVHLMSTENGREIYVMGHPEYDKETLQNEYRRDTGAGLAPAPPQHYYEGDDPAGPALFRWRAHGQLMYTNWLNYYVYQTTPFDLGQLEQL